MLPLPPGPGNSDLSIAQAAYLARFKDLTERQLPARASEQRWPIRLDHCFKRICLDHAFSDVWYRHLPKPAERHLSGDALVRALGCAEDLLGGDLTLLNSRNQASLAYRGKLRASPPSQAPNDKVARPDAPNPYHRKS